MLDTEKARYEGNSKSRNDLAKKTSAFSTLHGIQHEEIRQFVDMKALC